jgi:hypothetical protein
LVVGNSGVEAMFGSGGVRLLIRFSVINNLTELVPTIFFD